MKKVFLACIGALLVGATGIFSVASAAPSSSAETLRHSSYGPGFNNIYTPTGNSEDVTGAGVFLLENEKGQTIEAFCLVRGLPYSRGIFSPAGSSLPSSIPATAQLGKIVDIVTNSYNIGRPLLDQDAEAVAVQMAIWNLSTGDNITVNNIASKDSKIASRALELVNGASSKTVPTVGGGSLTIKVSSVEDNKIDVTVTVKDPSGAPIAGQTVLVDGYGIQETSASGTVIFSKVQRPATGSISASWSSKVLPGTIFIGENATSDQPIIVRTGFTFSRNVTVPVASSGTSIGSPSPSNGSTPPLSLNPGSPSLDITLEDPGLPNINTELTPGSGSTGVTFVPGDSNTEISIDLSPLDSIATVSTDPEGQEEPFGGRLAPVPVEGDTHQVFDTSKPSSSSLPTYIVILLVLVAAGFVLFKLRKAQA